MFALRLTAIALLAGAAVAQAQTPASVEALCTALGATGIRSA